MGSYEYKEIDFEHPSLLFIMEDKLKGLLGGPLFYNSYLKTFGLNGSEGSFPLWLTPLLSLFRIGRICLITGIGNGCWVGRGQ
jgi:hypothetical protein